jgi:hypothetical protein
MDDVRFGTWAVNIAKHLMDFITTSELLGEVEEIQFGGQCGLLLVRMSADETEKIALERVKVLARNAGIPGHSLQIYLKTAHQYGLVDWDAKQTIFEVLAMSRERILQTSAAITKSSISDSKGQMHLPDLLEWILQRPRRRSEVVEKATSLTDAKEGAVLVNIIEEFGLTGVEKANKSLNDLFFNEYQFEDRAHDYTVTLNTLNEEQQEQFHNLLKRVSRHPGIAVSALSTPPPILDAAVSLGLVDRCSIESPNGNADFLTPPRWSAPSVGRTPPISDMTADVFHQAKAFLCAWRYGQQKSNVYRGKIQLPIKLVDKLLSTREIGPATAIAQDYTLLEQLGVVQTVESPYHSNRRYMQLRRSEPVQMARDILDHGGFSTGDDKLIESLATASSFRQPETHARESRTASVGDDAKAKILRRLRSTTGGRR